jgi:hypothetical protein
MRKISIALVTLILLLCTACAPSKLPETGIAVAGITTSIGAVGEDTTNIETQSFHYTITLVNHETAEVQILSLEPTLAEGFNARVISQDIKVDVNQAIAPGGTLQVSGEILFDAKGLTKEEIEALQPFVKDFRITEERTIDRAF